MLMPNLEKLAMDVILAKTQQFKIGYSVARKEMQPDGNEQYRSDFLNNIIEPIVAKFIPFKNDDEENAIRLEIEGIIDDLNLFFLTDAEVYTLLAFTFDFVPLEQRR